mmetsp:Transcript_162454/g.520686  ORF Transcript_162454/g.520686 Transcript_162454/m.520686 type:complete len:142 (-) Transcript_162454:73-498(-)
MDDIIDQLEEAILADDVQAAAEHFMAQALPLFEGLTEEQLQTAGIDGEEQQLAWWGAYQQYVALMEERVLSACLAENPSLSREVVYAQLMGVAEAPAVEQGAAAMRQCAKFLLSMFEAGLDLGFGPRPEPPDGAGEAVDEN